jgi:hypothetical protein
MSNATLRADLLTQNAERIAALEFALSMTENCLRSHNMVIAFANGLCIEVEGNRVTNRVCDILKAPRLENTNADAVRGAEIRNGNGEQAVLRFDRDVLTEELAKARSMREWLSEVAA